MNEDKNTALNSLPRTIHPSEMRVFGSAPNLRYKEVASGPPRRFQLVYGYGDDLIAGLYDYANKEKPVSASFSAIGALQKTALAFFHRREKVYLTIPVRDQSELVSLTGNITKKGEVYVVHAHAVVSLADGKTLGGHLLYTEVWPTVELIVHEYDVPLERELDCGSDLWLINPTK